VAVSSQVSGSLSADSDTRLRIQPETVAGAGDVQALGVRSSSFGGHLADGQVFTQASVAGTYLYWQRRLLEADFGLIPTGVQSDLGAQAGSSLLGVSLRQGSASDSGPAVRLESAVGGQYRVLFRAVMLRPRPAGSRAAPARCWAFRPPCS